MKCYACNCRLSPDRDTCPKCGADIRLYRKIIYASNQYYNLGLARAKARDLTGAAECLRTSLQLYKKNISARNLLGLVYYEMGEAALALKEWVISKNLRHRGNIADDYIRDMRDNRQSLDSADHSIRKFNQALEYAKTGSKDMAVIQLKKVINVNPRMIKAYQLLALLYMEDQKYDQALDVIDRCLEIDRGNPGALSYKRELETTYKASKKKNSIGVAGELEREEVIIPVRMRDYGSYLAAAAYVLVGFLLSLGVLYYVIMPGKEAQLDEKSQAKIQQYEDKYASLNADITELEDKLEKLQNEKDQDAESYQHSSSESEQLVNAYQALLAVAKPFVEEDYAQAIDLYAALDANAVDDDTYKEMYQSIKEQMENHLNDRIFEKAIWKREHEGDRQAAIELCQKIIELDPSYSEAYFYVAVSAQELNQNDLAIDMYTQYIQRFPVGPQIQDARVNLNAIAPQVLRSLDAKPEVPNAAPEPAADPNAADQNAAADPNAAEPAADPNVAADPNAAEPAADQKQRQIQNCSRTSSKLKKCTKDKTQKRSCFCVFFVRKNKGKEFEMEKMENVTYMQAGPVLIIGLPEEVDDHVCNGIREETDRYISAGKVQKLIFDFLRLALWTAQVLEFCLDATSACIIWAVKCL